jgi:hypothetical protein
MNHMQQLITDQLDKIMSELECPKSFQCSRSGYVAVLQSKRFAFDYFTCIEANPLPCPHAIHYGYTWVCLCPLLHYVARKQQKKQYLDDVLSHAENDLVGRDTMEEGG